MKRRVFTPSALLPLLAMGLLLLAGCSRLASVPVPAPDKTVLEQVLTPPAEVPAAALDQPRDELLAVSPAMRHFLDTYITEDMSEEVRLDRLHRLLRTHPDYRVAYNPDATLTASEVFETRQANCLAFSALFIALAREVGIDTHFQEVDTPPSWDAINNNTLVQYRHINVHAAFGRREGVIDLRADRYSETFPQRIVSDSTGRAHYYSNLSMDHLVAGDLGRAYAAAKRGIEADPNQAFIWNNMGIIQRRLGNLDLAAASYRKALQLDPRDWSAYNNLALTLERQGDRERAKKLRAQAEHFKLQNPYYRYALAQHAFREGNYQEALKQVNVAIKRRSREHRFYYLRGLALWELGDSQDAIDNVERAIAVGERFVHTVNNPLVDYRQQLNEWTLASN